MRQVNADILFVSSLPTPQLRRAELLATQAYFDAQIRLLSSSAASSFWSAHLRFSDADFSPLNPAARAPWYRAVMRDWAVSERAVFVGHPPRCLS